MPNARNRGRPPRAAGFTLPELLAVVAIIALLMSASFGALSRARALARRTKAETQLRELVNAWASYYSTYWEWPPAIAGAQDVEVSTAMLRPLTDSGANPFGIVFLNYTPGGTYYLDPWGSPYRMSFGVPKSSGDDRSRTALETTVALPGCQKP